MNAAHGNPVIETSRLTLRLPELQDFEAMHEIYGDEQTARYIGGHLSRPASWRRFLVMPGAWAVQGFGMFSIVERATGELVGQCGPWHPIEWQGTEIGWAIRPQFFGRGYAFEAAVAAMDYACDVLGWTELIHTIHPDNASSIRLAERLGSRHVRDAELAPAGSGVHVGIWAQSAQDWSQHRQSFLHLLSP